MQGPESAPSPARRPRRSVSLSCRWCRGRLAGRRVDGARAGLGCMAAGCPAVACAVECGQLGSQRAGLAGRHAVGTLRRGVPQLRGPVPRRAARQVGRSQPRVFRQGAPTGAVPGAGTRGAGLAGSRCPGRQSPPGQSHVRRRRCPGGTSLLTGEFIRAQGPFTALWGAAHVACRTGNLLR